MSIQTRVKVKSEETNLWKHIVQDIELDRNMKTPRRVVEETQGGNRQVVNKRKARETNVPVGLSPN